MINFNYENDFKLQNEGVISKWIINVITLEDFKFDAINFIFCNDDYLIKLNTEFLNHDTLTDIISFDYTLGKLISGDVFISTERVLDNANDFNVNFTQELHRVIVHGILHFCGYKDKTAGDKNIMRNKEDFYIKLLK